MFDAIDAVPLRSLLSWCLHPSQPPLLHLTALSILGGASMGARECRPDALLLTTTQNELAGHALPANASLWPEHARLIALLLTPTYAGRVGETMARLVCERVLADVVIVEFYAVASNPNKAPDERVAQLFLTLSQCLYEEIRLHASEIGQEMLEMKRTGERSPQTHVEVANIEHIERLCNLIKDFM
ncbi:MAG: hypothetical protein SGPRY_012356 [Prymnesium sp.]